MKTEGKVNLSRVQEKSDKILTCHVGNQILKFLLPTEKNYSHLGVGERLFATLCQWVEHWHGTPEALGSNQG